MTEADQALHAWLIKHEAQMRADGYWTSMFDMLFSDDRECCFQMTESSIPVAGYINNPVSGYVNAAGRIHQRSPLGTTWIKF